MKTFLRFPLIALVLLLGACSTIRSRINENAPYFNSLDSATQSKIQHGDIDIGFTPRMVYIALGQPDAKRQRVTRSGTSETWIYRSYYDFYEGSDLVGYHRWFVPYGGFYRVYWEPVYNDFYNEVPEDSIRVTFRGGRVVTIDQLRT